MRISKLKSLLFHFLILLSVTLSGQQVKYAFFFIGDGMGLSHIALAEAYQAAVDEETGFKKLSFTEFPNVGLATTYAENRLITGSAAAGTALATGHKTTINTIGMEGKKEQNLQSISEMIKSHGWKVGIISSVSIDHATPAVFYAHRPHRNDYYEIGMQISKSGFDFFGGGGLREPLGDGSGKSIYLDLQESGYLFTNTREEFEKLSSNSGKVVATGNILGSAGALRYVIDQTDMDIPFENFVEKGIELLDNQTGFFMMAEEGKIDWAAHGNDGASVVHNVLSLSKAVDKAMAFYHQHPNETLIVVTADHETGGLALGFAGTHYKSDILLLSKQKVSTELFITIADSLIDYSSKPANGFKKTMDLVGEYFGIGGQKGLPLSELETIMLQYAYKHMTGEKKLPDDTAYLLYGGYNPIAVTASGILNNRAGISWTSWSHTAVPVPVFAIGPGSEVFNGYYDNTDIPKKIIELLDFNN
nr:alkaline phosphatase [Bacteroidota bacterium]